MVRKNESRLFAAAFLLVSCWAAPALARLDVTPPAAADIAAAESEHRGPYIAALRRAAPADPAQAGVWSADRRRWTLPLHAPGARWLSLRFDRYRLPPGAELRLHAATEEGADLVAGPYTSRHGRRGRLSTAMVPGDSATLELRLPDAGADYELHLDSVNWGFRDPRHRHGLAKSGGCNVDVACGEGDAWRDQIDSTVLLEIPLGGSSGFCSGTLVNNPRRDLTPYLLTADHCGVTAGNADGVIVYWRYQTASCRPQGGSHPPVSGPNPVLSQSGTEFLANGFVRATTPQGPAHPDFNLLIIGSALNPAIPPLEFSPYWSGWDRRRDRVATSGVGIHHPSGDEKAISRFDTPVSSETVDIGVSGDRDVVDAWQVTWAVGTTEQGSSGSGLWNQDGRLVGQLSGGEASCANQQGPDFYGRLDLAWEWENRASRQLRAWLDPDCTNPEVLDGIDRGGMAAGASPASAVIDAGLCPAPQPVCNDGVDNDGDGLTDFPDDPGCTSATDGDETDPPPPPACSDGLDNDGDGRIDGADPGCSGPGDNNEFDAPGGGGGGSGAPAVWWLLLLTAISQKRHRRP